MTSFAIALVLIAAFAHAGWNFLAKRACGGKAFIWLFASLSAIIYLPLALWILFVQKPDITWQAFTMIALSAIIHSFYFILLDKGYSIGDLSVIYPLARGTGPLLSTIIAITLLGERPGLLALSGTILIAIGIVIITGDSKKLKEPSARKPILFAVLCGSCIAAYTITDKIGVSLLFIPPLLYDWATNLGRVFLLTPYAIRNWDKVKEQWAVNKKEAFGVSVLSPLAYILVLTAMVFSPVSYIAPAREISILIGTVMGAKLLAEKNIKMRLVGASAMVAGLAALSFG